MTGSIPSKLGQFRGISALYLQRNRLSGSIPTEFGLLRNGYDGIQLDLSHNQLNGTIPDLQQLTDLAALDLSHNSLSGTLPVTLGALNPYGLLVLRLDSNALTGSIPSELGLLKSMKELDLSAQSLMGAIPHELLELAENFQLRYLNISGNVELQGSIPEALCALNPNVSDYGDFGKQAEICLYWFSESAVNPPQSYTCAIDFDCTSQLCGCLCPCGARTGGDRRPSVFSP